MPTYSMIEIGEEIAKWRQDSGRSLEDYMLRMPQDAQVKCLLAAILKRMKEAEKRQSQQSQQSQPVDDGISDGILSAIHLLRRTSFDEVTEDEWATKPKVASVETIRRRLFRFGTIKEAANAKWRKTYNIPQRKYDEITAWLMKIIGDRQHLAEHPEEKSSSGVA